MLLFGEDHMSSLPGRTVVRKNFISQRSFLCVFSQVTFPFHNGMDDEKSVSRGHAFFILSGKVLRTYRPRM